MSALLVMMGDDKVKFGVELGFGGVTIKRSEDSASQLQSPRVQEPLNRSPGLNTV